ncbi:hypothetical protein GWI33_011255, partial [Rhynchophorus ferrugineus]
HRDVGQGPYPTCGLGAKSARHTQQETHLHLTDGTRLKSDGDGGVVGVDSKDRHRGSVAGSDVSYVLRASAAADFSHSHRGILYSERLWGKPDVSRSSTDSFLLPLRVSIIHIHIYIKIAQEK